APTTPRSGHDGRWRATRPGRACKSPPAAIVCGARPVRQRPAVPPATSETPATPAPARSAGEGKVVRLPHLARQIAVRLVGMLAGEAFGLGIPRQGATGAQRNRAQVAHGRRAVAGLDVTNRRLARAHALEEIPHVIVAHLKAHGIR